MIKQGLRRPKEPGISREEFLRAAFELFCEKGYHETSVDDVVLRAKRSKGGFYHHFKSKSDLFLEMFETLIQQTLTPMEQAIRDGHSLRDIFVKQPPAYKSKLRDTLFLKALVELYLVAVRDADVQNIILRFNVIGINLIKKILRQSAKRGDIRLQVRNIGAIAEMIYHGSRGILIMEVILNNGRDLMPKMLRYIDHELTILKTVSKP